MDGWMGGRAVGGMGNESLLLLLLAACAKPSGGVAQGGRQIDTAGLVGLVDSTMAKGMAREGIPGAAFILVQGGRVVLAKGYGQADVAAGRAWSAERTVFPIASITKLFTATAVMQLADRGLIDLHADVNRYLKSVRVPATYPEPVTTAHLLSHTAGFDELPGRRVRLFAERADAAAPLPGSSLDQDPSPGGDDQLLQLRHGPGRPFGGGRLRDVEFRLPGAAPLPAARR